MVVLKLCMQRNSGWCVDYKPVISSMTPHLERHIIKLITTVIY